MGLIIRSKRVLNSVYTFPWKFCLYFLYKYSVGISYYEQSELMCNLYLFNSLYMTFGGAEFVYQTCENVSLFYFGGSQAI
jgi:hypothetical protein